MSRAWMPLYVADYLADTAHLSAIESGAYLHLIMHYWQTGGLPVEDDKLCRIARVHPPHWQRVRAVLEPFFGQPKTGGLWVQKRVALELAKNAELSNKRKAAAQQKHSNSSANAVQMHPQSQSPVQEEEKKGSEARASDDASAPSPLDADPRKALFDHALPWLAKRTGKSPEAMRSLIGRWLSRLRDDADTVLILIRQAKQDNVAEPISWIEGQMKPQPNHPPWKKPRMTHEELMKAMELLQ